MMLPTIWFILWGVLWAVYFMLDGFDLGLGTLMPFLAKDDTDRRVIYRAMGPFWDGNEVWLITAGGVTFAAFPTTYAVMFSGLYSALMLILFALILRGVSMVFRGEVDDPRWRRLWDAGLFLGQLSAGPAVRGRLCQPVQGHPHRRRGHLSGQPPHPAQPLRPGRGHPVCPAVPGSRLPVAGGQNPRRVAPPGGAPGGHHLAGASGHGRDLPGGHPALDHAL